MPPKLVNGGSRFDRYGTGITIKLNDSVQPRKIQDSLVRVNGCISIAAPGSPATNAESFLPCMQQDIVDLVS